MEFGAALLDAVLEELLPEKASGLVVGVSGGADSGCLLAALAERNSQALAVTALPLRAVHVDHGLQPAAAGLRESAVVLCRRLAVPLTVIEVSVEQGRDSLEAAARAARYGAWARMLDPGECLLTAHHADDQAETLLLQLLRGAGIKGMASMPARRRLGAGWHLRPLLELARADLEAYARDRGIESHDDPMNRNPRFERAFLRADLWPRIVGRWPGAARALGRAARHAADAQELLDQAADGVLWRLEDGDALSIPALRALPPVQRINAVRRWLTQANVRVPSSVRIAEGLRQMLTAESDRVPAVIWGAQGLRRYRDRVHLTAANLPAIAPRQEWPVAAQPRLELGAGLGALSWVPRRGGLDARRLPAVLCVKRRGGGESLKVAPRARTQTVAHLCQAMGIVPWMRDALPMIHAGDSLIAIGDLWRDARWLAAADAPGFECVWENAPRIA